MDEKSEVKKNPLINLVREEWASLGNRKKIFALYMALFAIAGAILLLNPLIIGLIFNSIQKSITSEAELTHLLFLISLLLAVDVGFWIFHGLGRVLEQRTGFFVHRNYINSKIKKVLELPVSWHKDNHSGSTIDKINRASQSLGNFSEHVTSQVLHGALKTVGSLIILFFVDPVIAIFSLGFSLFTLFVIINVDKKIVKQYEELNRYGNKTAAVIFDYISNIFTVITLRLKKTVSEEVDEKIMASLKTNNKSILLNEFKWGFASIALSLMLVLVLGYKAYSDYHATGIILIGTLYILYGYLNNVGETFFSFASLYGSLVRDNARIMNAYPIDEEYRKVEDEVKANLPSDWKEIEIRDLDFAYEEGKRKNLIDVNMKIKRGQKIALIGESGGGKSTILSVLRGLYPPIEGEVYCDGKRINHGFPRLKHQITLIPQNPEIFNNTIGYNITMGLGASKDDVKKVINMAQFRKVVDRLDRGLDTNVLEKGVSLSGGEKQRLALARGLLAAEDSDIILMDEPTSSVDSINEIQIHDNIFSEFRKKTIISSIHRLHLLEKFDYIYMFDNGRIVSEGTFGQMRNTSKFKAMWKKYSLKKEKEKN